MSIVLKHITDPADFSTWNRTRSSDELRSFIDRRFSAVAAIEIE